MNTYTLYWLSGRKEIIQGDSIAHAFMANGYGGGAYRSLDFWAEGEDEEYEWNAAGRRWQKVHYGAREK